MKRSAIFKDIAALMGAAFFIFIFVGTFLVYVETDKFMFHWPTLKWILSENIHYVLFLLLIMAFSVFGIVAYYRWALQQRRNCQVQYVELSKIAIKWMEYNDIETTIKSKVELDTTKASKKVELMNVTPNEISTRLLDLNTSITRNFVKSHILPFVGKLDQYEAKIIFDLLCLIEKNGNIPSVASMYENDPEKKTYGDKVVTMSGKTSYDILSEYTLIDHTMRVVEVAIAMHEESADIGKGIMYGRVIIAALAHDIGKICVNDDRIRISGEMYHKNPHEHISYMMFQEMYPDYPNVKMIADAIRAHHVYKVEGTVAILLKNADKKAREIEIGEWLIQNKEATKEASLSNRLTQQNVKGEKTTSVSSLPKEDTPPPVIDFIKGLEENPVESEDLSDEPIVAKKTEGKKSKQLAAEQKGDVPLEKKEDKKKTQTKFEYDFVEAHGEKFIDLLRENINSVEISNMTREEQIISVSVGDIVLFNYMFFKKRLEKITGYSLDKVKLEEIFLQLKNANIVKTIDVEKGFLVSKFIFESPSGAEEVNYVPVSCDALGVSVEDNAESKRQHPILRSINIKTFNKRNEL